MSTPVQELPTAYKFACLYCLPLTRSAGTCPSPTLAVLFIAVLFHESCIMRSKSRAFLLALPYMPKKTCVDSYNRVKCYAGSCIDSIPSIFLGERILGKYDSSIDQWDNIFSAETPAFPQAQSSGNIVFDKALEWLTENTTSVLDFGCGNGIVLFLCALHGTTAHIGIDLSAQAIRNAKAAACMAPCGEFHFECGSLEALQRLASSSVDAVILSNIIDNLYPEDAASVLSEIKRILRKNGRILLKLNPYITEAQIEAWGIRVIDGNLLDDGMILWNQTTEEWNAFLGAQFRIVHFEDIYYEEYAQYNRMYYLLNQC